MSVIETRLDTRSPAFAKNRDALVDGVRTFLRSLDKPEGGYIKAESLEMRLQSLAKQALLVA